MLPTTKNAIKALLSADPTVPQEDSRKLYNLLERGLDNAIAKPSKPDRVLTFKEAAEMLAVTNHTVSVWARNGKLKPVYGTSNRQRAFGVTQSSVQGIMRESNFVA